MADDKLTAGSTAFDEKRKCLARVMDPGGAKVVLRPLAGGTEWWQDRDVVRPALASDLLSDRMHRAGLLRKPEETP